MIRKSYSALFTAALCVVFCSVPVLFLSVFFPLQFNCRPPTPLPYFHYIFPFSFSASSDSPVPYHNTCLSTLMSFFLSVDLFVYPQCYNYVHVCKCVCVRERERDVCVCVCVWERERERERERDSRSAAFISRSAARPVRYPATVAILLPGPNAYRHSSILHQSRLNKVKKPCNC